MNLYINDRVICHGFKTISNYSIGIEGCHGTVTHAERDQVCVKLDRHFDDLDEWDNECVWIADDVSDDGDADVRDALLMAGTLDLDKDCRHAHLANALAAHGIESEGEYTGGGIWLLRVDCGGGAFSFDDPMQSAEDSGASVIFMPRGGDNEDEHIYSCIDLDAPAPKADEWRYTPEVSDAIVKAFLPVYEDVKAALASAPETIADRIESAFQSADTAFWAAVAEAFPEAKSGDFGPDETWQIESAMLAAIQRWVSYNVPGACHACTQDEPDPNEHESHCPFFQTHNP